MRKMILVTWIVLLMLPLDCFKARADGAMFPMDAGLGYLQVLTHDVTVTIRDQQVVTRVVQEFYNPYDQPVSTRYVFPVPPGSTLTRFKAWVDQAEAPAIRQGVSTSNQQWQDLVLQWRDPSLLQYLDWESYAFDLELPAGATRRMVLEYEEILTPSSGLYAYRYTLGTERYVSAPLQRATIHIDAQLSAGLGDLYSPSHRLSVERISAQQVRASWDAESFLGSDDFSLFYAPAASGFGGGLLAGANGDQNYLAFLFSPGAPARSDAMPKDIVFVFDRSGSMDGEKIAQARQALNYFVTALGDKDRFSIVAFNSERQVLSTELLARSPESDRAAGQFIAALDSSGNTDIEAALLEGLNILHHSAPRPEALQLVVFLTDGLPTAGNMDDDRIVADIAIRNATQAARIHTFGVGYDVNTHLLDRLAAQNNGSVTYVQPGDDLAGALKTFYDQVAYPVLTDVSITWEGIDVADLYPAQLPDLFVGSSLLLTGRYQAAGDSVSVRVSGNSATGPQSFVYTFSLAEAAGNDFVPRLWATRRVGALLDEVRVNGESSALVDEIRDLGLRFGVVTPYTTYVVYAQASGAASAANMANYADAASLNQVSGQVTVQARMQNQMYQGASQANLAQGANTLNIQNASLAQISQGESAPLNVDLSIFRAYPELTQQPVTADWVAQNVSPDRQVIFGSSEYFAMAADPDLRPFLQSGVNVIFAHGTEVIQVSDGLPRPPSLLKQLLLSLFAWLRQINP